MHSSDGKIPVIFIQPYGKALADAMVRLKEDPQVEVVEYSNFSEAVGFLLSLENCVLLFHVTSDADVVKNERALAVLKQKTETEKILTIVTSTIEHVTLSSKLAFFGCREIIREPIASRSFLFKIQRHLNALQKRNVSRKPSLSKTKALKPKKKVVRKNEPDSDSGGVRFIAALELETDFWVLSEELPAKAGSNWLVKLLGPKPSVGKWDREDGHWVWKVVDLEAHPYFEDSAAWQWKGSKPEFKDGFWCFAGSEIELGYYEGAKCLGKKLSLDHFSSLNVSRTSEMGKRLIPTYLKTSDPSSAPVKAIQDAATEEVTPQLSLVDSLEIESECWLFSHRKPKWVNGKWVMKLVGPGPKTGKWIEVEGNAQRWRWIQNDPKDTKFIKEIGNWEFAGLQPRFEKDGWIFASASPVLEFCDEVHSFGEKIATDESHSVFLARDSAIGESMLPAIKETWGITQLTSTPENLKPDLHVFKNENDSVRTINNRLTSNPDPERQINNRVTPDAQSKGESSREVPANRGGSNRSLSFSNSLNTVKFADQTTQPKQKPLSLGVLVAEMAGSGAYSLQVMGRTFCSSVSAAFEGVRIELWYLKDSSWVCASTGDDKPGRLEPKISATETFPQKTSENILVATVVRMANSENPDDQLIGALIFGEAGVERVSVDAAQSYSSLAKGLIEAFILK